MRVLELQIWKPTQPATSQQDHKLLLYFLAVPSEFDWAGMYLTGFFECGVAHTLGCDVAHPRVRRRSSSNASACCSAGPSSNPDSTPHKLFSAEPTSK